jgi:hypothetical protein
MFEEAVIAHIKAILGRLLGLRIRRSVTRPLETAALGKAHSLPSILSSEWPNIA